MVAMTEHQRERLRGEFEAAVHGQPGDIVNFITDAV
jgi:hypothetical protein